MQHKTKFKPKTVRNVMSLKNKRVTEALWL